MVLPKPFLLSVVLLLGTAAVAGAHPKAPPAFKLRVFAGAPAKRVFGPDDITSLDGHVFVGWQNGIGAMGQPGPGHQTRSLVVEYGTSGRAIARFSLTGRVEGLGGDPGIRGVIATVNEDGHSSLYVLKPAHHRSIHFRYAPSPDGRGTSAVHTGGGSDSVVVWQGQILVSASNPSHLSATATFRVKLGTRGIAHLLPTFADDALAQDAVAGNTVHLKLTDPAANAMVPAGIGDPFGGYYALDGQADQELVFATGKSLVRLRLTDGGRYKSAGVVDVRWAPTDNATLYVVDNGANRIYRVTGPFRADAIMASMDSLGLSSFTSQVAWLNDRDGSLTAFITGLKAAKGLLFTS